jgi:hypothetical protein
MLQAARDTIADSNLLRALQARLLALLPPEAE